VPRGRSLEGWPHVHHHEANPLLLFHLAAAGTRHPADIHGEIDAQIAARQVAGVARVASVPGALRRPTRAATRFFSRRVSGRTRASGSPACPYCTGCGVKPGKRYPSLRWGRGQGSFGILKLREVPDPSQGPFSLGESSEHGLKTAQCYPHKSTKSPLRDGD
jgi:hypothetical protein